MDDERHGGCDCPDTFDCHGKWCSAGDPPPADTPAAIARDLADCDPLWHSGECMLCGAETRAGDDHASACPWRRARALVTP